MKVGIVADDWKAPTFRKNLKQAGFPFTERSGPTHYVTFTVETEDADRLREVVKAANREAQGKLGKATRTRH